MIYNAKNSFDCIKAEERLKYLISNEKKFELTEKKPLRTLSQNNYLHLILSYFALEYGETAEYTKQKIFKKIVNPQIFITEYVNRKSGEIREELRSTGDLDTKELTDAINRFMDYSSKIAGIYLPRPEDVLYLEEIEKQISNQKQYL
jgi:hypothetical protein